MSKKEKEKKEAEVKWVWYIDITFLVASRWLQWFLLVFLGLIFSDLLFLCVYPHKQVSAILA